MVIVLMVIVIVIVISNSKSCRKSHSKSNSNSNNKSKDNKDSRIHTKRTCCLYRSHEGLSWGYTRSIGGYMRII